MNFGDKIKATWRDAMASVQPAQDFSTWRAQEGHQIEGAANQLAYIFSGAKPGRRLRFTIENTKTGKDLPKHARFWHEGRCGRCGRTLTDPESIGLGIGPICRQKGREAV